MVSEQAVWALSQTGYVNYLGGAVIHRSEVVKAFLKNRPEPIHLERLPAYSLQLNPVELV